ncbi:TPA: hypothetical protein ACT9A3_002995 [Legionella pneumophila]|nr:hypothetical protein [Legionella pneumophila]HAU0884418.1 hypothetical protein [Legionella pneumophila]HDO7950414.1 hypothetical protein [Legionella pneumophila]HDO7953364.1 hypothetical protein [Legionella pneumophila]HDO8180296.1 hypothetical protein [Legionella pneumophila]
MTIEIPLKYKRKPASQDEINLYCLVGEALCMVQYLEDILSHSITLKKEVKKPLSMPVQKANEFLEEYRKYTLGRAIKLAKKEGIYSEELQQSLDNFLSERNWLVHKCMPQNREDMYSETNKFKLFHKIKSITENAHILLESIETDLINCSLSNGLDMSNVKAVIQQYYE